MRKKTTTTRADAQAQQLLRAENKALLSEVTGLRKNALTEARVLNELRDISSAPVRAPKWLVTPGRGRKDLGRYGTPTLFLSDVHLGEVVDPEQIRGCNSYNLAIAKRRWRVAVESTIDLLSRYFVSPKYDGIVLALGGDMVSGDIHEELAETNEMNIGPSIIETAGLIEWSARTLRDAFGKVFIPAVVGNHGRFSKKPRAKAVAWTNADWIAYQVAARGLTGEKGITMAIPSGPDLGWKLYNHRYMMTHGNQFRGGDGFIGPLGPVFRGDAKKRATRAQVGDGYDTLMIGHFHQLRMDNRLVMNGSIKGYDEYAFSGNFPFEAPKQALWMTHPERGITFSIPVLLDAPPTRRSSEWLEWRRVDERMTKS